jgi:hypothetical protein
MQLERSAALLVAAVFSCTKQRRLFLQIINYIKYPRGTNRFALGTQGRQRLKSASLCAFALLTPMFAIAQIGYSNSLLRSNYIAKSGDYNGDGIPDVLMIAIKRVVLIDYDIPIPVAIPTPSPSFAILSSGPGNYSLDTSPSAGMIASGVWQSSTYDMVYGDILGNGAGGVVLRAKNAGLPSFSLGASPSNGAPQLIQVLSSSALGVDISGASGEVRLGDMNGDGRADLTVVSGGVVVAAYAANTNGQYVRDENLSIRATWQGVRSALEAGDRVKAALHIAEDSREFYSTIFQEMGQYLPTATNGWSDITPLEILADESTWFMTVTAQGETTGHIVNFTKVNGTWQIGTF